MFMFVCAIALISFSLSCLFRALVSCVSVVLMPWSDSSCCSCCVFCMRKLMYSLEYCIMSSSVGLGHFLLKNAISSAFSGRCKTLVNFLYLILMSSSVTSGVLCVVRLVVVVDVSGV